MFCVELANGRGRTHSQKLDISTKTREGHEQHSNELNRDIRYWFGDDL